MHSGFAETETFLYAPHMLPPLLLLAVPADTTRRWRWCAAALWLVLTTSNGVAWLHNLELAGVLARAPLSGEG